MDNFSASLLDGAIVFGKYPTQEEADLIVRSGFTHIVDLTCPEEITWTPYVVPITYRKYPFEDGRSQKPRDGWDTFQPLVDELVALLRDGNKLYIHCLGGHNRSAGLAAILYGLIERKTSEEAIAAVYQAHQARNEMKAKWRKLGAPQRAKQKQIIKKYL